MKRVGWYLSSRTMSTSRSRRDPSRLRSDTVARTSDWPRWSGSIPRRPGGQTESWSGCNGVGPNPILYTHFKEGM